jgi:hypothetical protein
MDAAFGNWLAGFIDGEGCFRIKPINQKDAPGWMCIFVLKLRDDDAAILRLAHAETGIGRLYPHKGEKGQNPGLAWWVQRRMECVALTFILSRFQLRAKKRHDFVLWREAVEAWTMAPPDFNHMEKLAAELKEWRTYANTPP